MLHGVSVAVQYTKVYQHVQYQAPLEYVAFERDNCVKHIKQRVQADAPARKSRCDERDGAMVKHVVVDRVKV